MNDKKDIIEASLCGGLSLEPFFSPLYEEIDEMRQRFIQLYTRRDHLLSHERDNLYCRYVELIGRRVYSNFCLSVEVRALKMKVEMAQAAVNHNQRPRLSEIEATVRSRLEDYYEEMAQRAKAIRDVEEAERIASFTVTELRNLYRTLVRRLHPDLHPDLSEEMIDLFMKGQAAYRSYDVEVLREIIKRLDMEGDLTECVIADRSPEETLRRLEQDVKKLEDEIEALKETFPFCLEMKLLDPVWVKEQQDEQEEERSRLEAQRKIYEERLSILAG
ncbi:MAG: J domain-containing protein [Bacteroidales bacterium]|nr:J domain-containing protein [Bacteroidales bacterium]